jgi:hypothetical protein
MATTTPSTLTAQKLIDYARTFPWTKPAVGLAGYSDQPAVSFLDEIVKRIMNKSNPWKWNANKFPGIGPGATGIETQPYQQDYPTSISQNTMGWLQSAVICDINNAVQPSPILPINTVDRLLPTMIAGRPQKVCWITNSMAATAIWGRGRQGDPGPGAVYTDPLVLNGGGPSSNNNTAITDANGNILVVTTYGVCGSVAPLAAPSAAGGTAVVDGGVIWTVQDPNGVALRLDALATFQSIVWEVRVLYQQKPPTISTLTQNIAPIPDDLNYLVKQGFLAYCFKQADSAKFPQEFAQWLESIQEAMGSSDREYQEFGFYPAQPIQGGYGEPGVGTWGYPGWPGWQ